MKLADLDKHGLNWNKILDFCKKNIRYISAGGIGVILIIVLAVTTLNPDKKEEGSKDENVVSQDQENSDQDLDSDKLEAFSVDAIPEINTLIQNYYSAYAAGDIATIEGLATPISDIEKSYITFMSQYISGYTNIHVYSKPGLFEEEYAVSVSLDMGFEGVQTAAPGLDFFYIRKNETGVYVIDNLYSYFNLHYEELELDSQIREFIKKYEGQEDVLQLCFDIQAKYEAVLTADEELKDMIEVTIPQLYQTWMAQAPTDDTQTPSDDTQTPTDDTQTPTDDTQTPSDDTQTPTDDTQTPSDNGSSSGINYVPEGKILTLNKAMNVRKGMGESFDIVGTTDPGDKVEVILSYKEGWTKVKWNDKTGYIRTDLLLNN